jgi:hypothetical protein
VTTRCAWCGILLGVKEPFADESTTHGICPACAERYCGVPRPDRYLVPRGNPPGAQRALYFRPDETMPGGEEASAQERAGG